MIDLEPIKAKSCVDYLQGKGFDLDKKSSKQYSFFKSPLRDEKTASFCVNNSKNTWFDYGAACGGDVIRLVEMIEGVNFKEAIKILEPVKNTEFKPVKKSNSLKIIKAGPINDSRLINYLVKRKLNIDLILPYINQVSFLIGLRQNIAIGFKNDKQGFEIRNKHLKISTTPKYFTTINKDSSTAYRLIFEGFMDFLSAITYYKKQTPHEVIILNSASFIGQVVFDDKQNIFFGDNDPTGTKCFEQIPNAIDKRDLYKNYNDFNEMIMNNL